MPPTRNRGRNNGRNSGRRNLGRPNAGQQQQQQQQLQPSLRLCHPDRNRYRPFDQGPSYGTSPGSQRQVHPLRDERRSSHSRRSNKSSHKATMASADVQRSVWQSRFQMPSTCLTTLVLRPTTLPLDHIDAIEQYYRSNWSNDGLFNDQQRRRQPAIGDRRSPIIAFE
jgi:hypothetical protein